MDDAFGTKETTCAQCARAGAIMFLRSDPACEMLPEGWFIWRYRGLVALLCSDECVLAWKVKLDQEEAVRAARDEEIRAAFGSVVGAAREVVDYFKFKRRR